MESCIDTLALFGISGLGADAARKNGADDERQDEDTGVNVSCRRHHMHARGSVVHHGSTGHHERESADSNGEAGEPEVTLQSTRRLERVTKVGVECSGADVGGGAKFSDDRTQ